MLRALLLVTILTIPTTSACAVVMTLVGGSTIPGTEDITLGPGVDLSGWNTEEHNLRNAYLSYRNLSGGNFSNSWLDGASFEETDVSASNFSGSRLDNAYMCDADLTGANLMGARLANVNLCGATLTNADFTDSVINGAQFHYAASSGFTKEQFYSTASYKNSDISGIWLQNSDLSGRDFHGQNMMGVYLYDSTVSGADFTDAIVKGAQLGAGMTTAQIRSTASYKSKDLSGLGLDSGDLSGCDLSGQNLTDVRLGSVTLTGANMTDAIVKGAHLWGTTACGFTKEQLYSTASYKSGDLESMEFGRDDVSGWDFHNQNIADGEFYMGVLVGTDLRHANLQHVDFGGADMRGARLDGANVTNAALDGADLTDASMAGADLTDACLEARSLSGADFTDAVIRGAHLSYRTAKGFTKEQLYSTASYKNRDLRAIDLDGDDISGWDLRGQSLAGALFSETTISGTDLSRADLRGASVSYTSGTPIIHDTIWTDGTIAGLQLTDGEELVIRNYAMAITANSSWTMTEGAKLKMVLESDWQSVINVGEGVVPDLGGTLEIALAEGVDPVSLAGMEIKLFNWNGRLGEGEYFDNIVFAPYTGWDISRLYTDGVVRLAEVPEPMTLAMMALGGLAVRRRR